MAVGSPLVIVLFSICPLLDIENLSDRPKQASRKIFAGVDNYMSEGNILFYENKIEIIIWSTVIL